MKGLEKLTSIRLAEVLTHKGAVPTDVITDALYTQDRHGESFVDLLVSGGNITEWDLSKMVVENFQLPFIMAGNYEISDTARDGIPKQILFENLIVPMDNLGNIMTVIMPILTPFEVLSKIQKECKVELFPYVGLISENKRVLGELFPDFAQWQKDHQAALEAKSREVAPQAGAKDGEGDWANIFDAGDAMVRSSIDGKKEG